MLVNELLKEMNVQNAIHLDCRNGNRSTIILNLEKKINALGYSVVYKYGSFSIEGI